MERDEVGARSNRRVERGDVGISDECARTVAPGGVVETIEEARRAVAATNAPDGVDRRVLGESIEIGAARVVRSGERRLRPRRLRVVGAGEVARHHRRAEDAGVVSELAVKEGEPVSSGATT